MAAQKKIGSAIAILTLLLNPRDAGKSQQGEITQTFCGGSHVGCSRSYSSQGTRWPVQLVYTAMGALIDGYGS
jgi:hypothetical protein